MALTSELGEKTVVHHVEIVYGFLYSYGEISWHKIAQSA